MDDYGVQDEMHMPQFLSGVVEIKRSLVAPLRMPCKLIW